MKSQTPLTSLGNFFARYNLTIFIVLLVAGLGVAVYTLTAAFEAADPLNSNGTTSVNSSFATEDATVEEVKQLKTSSANTPAPLPSGRINPFGE